VEASQTLAQVDALMERLEPLETTLPTNRQVEYTRAIHNLAAIARIAVKEGAARMARCEELYQKHYNAVHRLDTLGYINVPAYARNVKKVALDTLIDLIESIHPMPGKGMRMSTQDREWSLRILGSVRSMEAALDAIESPWAALQREAREDAAAAASADLRKSS